MGKSKRTWLILLLKQTSVSPWARPYTNPAGSGHSEKTWLVLKSESQTASRPHVCNMQCGIPVVWFPVIFLVFGLGDGGCNLENKQTSLLLRRRLGKGQSQDTLLRGELSVEERGAVVGLGSLHLEFHSTLRRFLPAVLLPGSPACQNRAWVSSRRAQRQPAHRQIIRNKYYEREGETWHLG